jgi:hypothetical protein
VLAEARQQSCGHWSTPKAREYVSASLAFSWINEVVHGEVYIGRQLDSATNPSIGDLCDCRHTLFLSK